MVTSPATRRRNAHRLAQAEPHLSRRDAGRHRLLSGAVSQRAGHLVAKHRRRVAGAELVVHQPPELTPSHRARMAHRLAALIGRTIGYTAAMTTVPIAEAKNRLSEYVTDVERTHHRVRITRHGRTAAVLISADDLAALEETVDLQATPGAEAAIAEGLADLHAGRIADNESLRARYLR